MVYHVVFLQQNPMDRVASGQKRYEVRLFNGWHPSLKVQVGDTLLFKRVGGEVEFSARVTDVHKFDKLRPCDVDCLARLFCRTDEWALAFWRSRRNRRNAVIVEFDDPVAVRLPKESTPRGAPPGWVAPFSLGNLAVPVSH